MIVLGVVAVAAVLGARALRARRMARARTEAVRDALVPVADLVVLAIGAGCTVAEAVELLSRRAPPAVRPQFDQIIDGVELGVPLAVELRRLGRTIEPSYETLGLLLAEAMTQGGAIGSVVSHLSAEARMRRDRRVEARLNQLPVSLIVPLACCGLPAVVLAGVVPLAILSLGQLWS